MAEPRTRGQIEAAVTAALTQFEWNFLGRGHWEAHTFIVQDLLRHLTKGALDVIKTENLYAFEGKPAFSIAQGE